ncbi:MAG: hypothetical protein ACI9XC_001880 [Gammaproteobacteria bacterium]|jgi:hypothetical protein
MKETKQDKSTIGSNNINLKEMKLNKKNYHCPDLEEYGSITDMTLAVSATGMGDGAMAGNSKIS